MDETFNGLHRIVNARAIKLQKFMEHLDEDGLITDFCDFGRCDVCPFNREPPFEQKRCIHTDIEYMNIQDRL